MQTNGNDTGATFHPGYWVIERGNGMDVNMLPHLALGSVCRDILNNSDRLPDTELMRIAGRLRTVADEVMAVVDRRLGFRPRPRLVVDNTRPR